MSSPVMLDYTTYTILQLCEALANVEVAEEQLSEAGMQYSSHYDNLRPKRKL